MAKWVVLLFVALLCGSVRPEPPQRLIEDPPVILLHPTPPFLATGSRLSLACAAYGNPIPNITWSSPTQGIFDYGLLSATEESVNITEMVIDDISGIRYVLSILELCNSEPSHLTTHTYTCVATNGVTGVGLGNSSTTFDIQPTALEPATLVSHPNGSFEYGGRRISLACAAFGSPAPDITWGFPTLGIANMQPLADADNSVNIYTEELSNTRVGALVLSTLELCNNDPSDKDIEISCTTSNGITTDLLGNQSASFFLDPYVEISTFSYEQMPATAQLHITFLGVVDTSVFKCNLSALQFLNTSSPMDPYSNFFSPQYPGRCEQVTNSTLTAYLDSRDYITLLTLGIFSSGANSYLSWKKTFLGPLLTVTETEIAYQVQTFVAQTHQVILLGFDLDFNAGQLFIHFGSIIDVASIDISGVTLSNGNATQDFSLTGGDIVSDSYATTVCIDMSNEDLLNLQNREICTSLENCIATFSSGFAIDAFGNSGDVRTLKVSVLRKDFIVPNPAVYLSVTTEYIGCAANVSLVPNEVYIVREMERIIRIDCHTTGPDINPVLSWQQGGLLLNGTAPPFMNNWPYHSYAYFPEGMPVAHYGLFTCTSQRGEHIEHYIHNINPFVGTPDRLISVTLYGPIHIPVSIASIPQQSLEDIKVSFEPVNHSQPILPEIRVAEFKASISFDHALYSFEGSYNIVFNLTALDVVTYTTVTIKITDPIVNIFPRVVVIEQLGSVMINCTSSSPELPVHWTIGNREIQDGGPFTLTPPGLHHSLQVLLDTSDQGLLRGPFSCFVEDPELNTIVASDVAPLHIVPDELTVWRNGMERLLDNSLLLLNDEDDGSLNLRCLGTQGNYDLIWKTVGISDLPQVVSSPTPDVNVSYLTNDANLTLHNFRRFEGTLRCESQQSGLAISILFTTEESPRTCGVDTDQIWNITWGITFAGAFDNQLCPEVRGTPVTGLAYRYCNEDATWETLVNVSSCRSMAFETLETMAEMLFETSSSLHDDDRDVQVSILGEALANATDPSPATSLFPQDLDTANNILDGIVVLLRENIAARRPASLHTELIDTFNNMLSTTNEEGWKQLQEMKAGSQKLLYNAEQYGIYLTDALDTTSIDTDEYGSSIPLLRTNIMIEAQKLSQNHSQVMDIVYPASDHPLSDKAQIVLPASLLIAKGAKAVVNILFVNLEDFLPDVDISIGTMTATMVLSSQIVTEQTADSESEFAELHFSTYMIENSANPRCVFWNFSDPIGEGMWSTEGVETNTVEKKEDSFNLACTSEHFTSFAAIVDISQVFVFTVPMYVGIGVLLLCSVVAAMVLLIVFLVSCIEEVYTGLHYFVHLSFASATICACIVILGGLTTALVIQGACIAVAALLQYFFTAAFSWLLCEAIVLIIMLSVRDYGSLSKCWWFAVFLLGWGLPAIVTAISTGLLYQQFGTSKHCWISFENGEKSQLLWAFVGPILAIVLMTGVFLIISLGCKITFFCRKLKDGSKRNDYIRAWILFVGTLLLVPLLGGACAFGLLTVNEIWVASEWLLMAFSIAAGVTFLLFTVLVITTDQKGKEPAAKARESLSGSRDAVCRSDTKPILPEASGSSYELKVIDLEISTSDGERGPMETATSTKMEEDP